MTFFTDSEVASFQGLVTNLGFRTDVAILPRTTVINDGGQGDSWATTPSVTVKGWLFSTPTKEMIINAGEQVTANTYRLFLPVGTPVTPGDQCQIGTDFFVFTDTVEESTWLPLLRCGLRKLR